MSSPPPDADAAARAAVSNDIALLCEAASAMSRADCPRAKVIVTEAASRLFDADFLQPGTSRAQLSTIADQAFAIPSDRTGWSHADYESIVKVARMLVSKLLLTHGVFKIWEGAEKRFVENNPPPPAGTPDNLARMAIAIEKTLRISASPHETHLDEVLADLLNGASDITDKDFRRRINASCADSTLTNLDMIMTLLLLHQRDMTIEKLRLIHHKYYVNNGCTWNWFYANLIVNGNADPTVLRALVACRPSEPVFNVQPGWEPQAATCKTTLVNQVDQAAHVAVGIDDVQGGGIRALITAFPAAKRLRSTEQTINELQAMLSGDDVQGGQEFFARVHHDGNGNSALDLSAVATALVELLKGQRSIKHCLTRIRSWFHDQARRRPGTGPRGGDVFQHAMSGKQRGNGAGGGGGGGGRGGGPKALTMLGASNQTPDFGHPIFMTPETHRQWQEWLQATGKISAVQMFQPQATNGPPQGFQ
jgi:hypothetical protein